MPGIFESFDPPTVYRELAELPLGETSVTPLEIRLTLVFLSNSADVPRKVIITNAAGSYLAKDMELPANSPAPALEFPFMYMNGLKITPDGAGVVCHVEGYPDV